MTSLKIKRSRRAQNSDKISNFTKSAFHKYRKLTIRDWLGSNRLGVRKQMTEQKITQDHQRSSHPSIANHDQVAIYTHHTLMPNRSSLVIAPVIRLETPHLYCEPRVSTAIDPRNRFTPILVLTVQLHTVRSNSHSFSFRLRSKHFHNSNKYALPNCQLRRSRTTHSRPYYEKENLEYT